MRAQRRVWAVSAWALSMASFSGSGLAAEPMPNTIQFDGVSDLMPNGDGRAQYTYDLTEADYAKLKARTVNPQKLLKHLQSERSDFEVDPASTVRFDDVATAVKMDVVQIGALKNLGGGRWQLPIERQADFVNFAPRADGRVVGHLYEVGDLGGVLAKGQLRVVLPTGATNAEWDAAKHVIRYRLPRPDGVGPCSVDVSAQAKPRIMSGLYKVYGLGTPDLSAQWVGKASIKNTGSCVARDVRIRWKVEGYSEWSPWDKFPEMVPGQTVVSVYYPVLDRSIATLTTTQPANVLVQWRFTDLEGKTHEDDDGARIVILGRHEFVFYDTQQGADTATWAEMTPESPLISAWVSRDDLVVKQFAAMANKIAGGVGSTGDERKLQAVMEAIYTLWLRNDFTYQYPPALQDKTISFDPRLVQNIKHPRDVIRDKSGTCIDLAICYAAMANALGMEPLLALIPGHCFPVIRWQGSLYPFEATAIAGGPRFAGDPERAPDSFKGAVDYAVKNLQKHMQEQSLTLVDVQHWWTRGVAGPELEPLPANVLSEWGISLEGVHGGGEARPATVPEAQLPVIPAPGPEMPNPGPAPGGDVDFSGTWRGEIVNQVAGQRVANPTVITIWRGNDGQTVEAKSVVRRRGPDNQLYDVTQIWVGTASGGTLSLICREVYVALVGTNQQQQGWPDGQVSARIEGGRLVGRAGSDQSGFVEFSFARQP